MTASESQSLFFESQSAEPRLQVAERFLRSLPLRSGALILTPSPGAALWLTARVLERGEARVGWLRRTLDTLAQELALPELLRRDLAPLRGLGCEALCARVLHEAGAAHELGRYAGLHQRPGFAPVLADALNELRLAGIEPKLIDNVDPALARLLRRYATALEDAKLADRALLLAAACSRASEGATHGRVPLLAVDVLLRDRAEAQFVAALCRDRLALCVVHPSGDPRSSAHWAGALAGCDASRQAHGSPETASPQARCVSAANLLVGREPKTSRPDGTARDPRASPGPHADQTDLQRLQARLFSVETDAVVPPVERGHVQLISSPGESREAVEVARGLLAAAAQGTPFDRMAVVLRAVDNYRVVMEEALARAQVPAHFADGVRRPAPEGRALLALLRCAQQGLSARAFAEYLSLSVTPARQLDGEWGGVSPRHWERLLIDSSVLGGRERWQRRLAGHANALQAELEALDLDDPVRTRRAHEIERLRALANYAEPLLDALDGLPEGGNWGQWLSALDALARQALRAPTAVCETLAELAPLGPLAPIGLREVLRVLRRRLGSTIARSTGSGAGAVFVGGIDDVLGRSFERVFVPGLAEKIFPQRIDPDPLLPDRLRVALGPTLLQPDERVGRERMAMRIAVGAARAQLVLSFPRFDVEHNRARVPSFYGLEALRAIDGTLPAFDELARRADSGAAARLGWPAPQLPELAIDDAEYDLAMLAQLRSHGAERTGAARYFLASNAHLARALRFRARRWTIARFMAPDGLVLDADRSELLAPHQLDARSYSATALAQFAACPYKFYLHAIADVSAREQTLELDELDARQRGVLFHAAQRAVLEALRERAWLPLPAERAEAAQQLLEHVFAELATAARERYAPAISRVFDAALQSTRADLQQWLLRLQQERSWHAIHVELGFGTVRPELDRDSRSQPVQLEGGLSLRGAIDVVERRAQPDAEGRAVLRATDHKTGALPDKLGTISGGRVLQPALYALALERLFPEAKVESGRLYFCTSRAGFLSHEVPLDDATRAAGSRLTSAVEEHLRAGFLPAAPAEGECARCTYQVVCGPYEEERVGRVKARAGGLERLGALYRLRVTP